jgi:hypothetical protein
MTTALSATVWRRSLLVAAAVAVAVSAVAQEGHPLTGTWYGEYSDGNQKHDLTVIMKWDGKAVSGLIDPGPNATPLTTVAMDITPGKPAPEGQDSTRGIPPRFHVRIEADMRNPAGAAERIVFQGEIRNPVAGNRQIVGTWMRGTAKGSFQIRRL